MIFDNFSLRAEPFVQDARCKCGNDLKEVSDGFFSAVWYCPKCENIYQLKLIKTPAKKVSERFLKVCRERAKKK